MNVIVSRGSNKWWTHFVDKEIEARDSDKGGDGFTYEFSDRVIRALGQGD